MKRIDDHFWGGWTIPLINKNKIKQFARLFLVLVFTCPKQYFKGPYINITITYCNIITRVIISVNKYIHFKFTINVVVQKFQ